MAAAFQNIASAAWARQAVIAMPSGTFKDLLPGDLMRALRGAWAKVQGNPERVARVESIARSIAARLGQPGPVQVSPSSLGMLNSFAGIASTSPERRRQVRK